MTAAGSLQRLRWHHPEAAAAGAAACAWALLTLPFLDERVRAAHAQAHATAPVLAGAFGWLLMITAMMLPTALPAARFLGVNALWRRRRRTAMLFLATYLGVWAAFGAVAIPAAALVERQLGLGAPLLLGGVLALAALWELTPTKWRALRACHIVDPVPPAGPRADRACAVAAVRYGRRCVLACWPAMLAMAIAGHANLGLMVLLSVVIVSEKLALRPASLATPAATVLTGAALIAIATA